MALHLNNIGPLVALLRRIDMGLHLKNVRPLHAALAAAAPTALAKIESCGIRDNPKDQIGGYCQGLFARQENPTDHTYSVSRGLAQAEVKYPESHEIFYCHKPDDVPFADFIAAAVRPFREGKGCAPVVITGLEATDVRLEEIFATGKQLEEPILVRMVVSRASAEAAASLLKRLIAQVENLKDIPAFWPLFQGSPDLDLDGWRALCTACESAWAHACVAISPFTKAEELAEVGEQVVVAQVPIGHKSGMVDGRISLDVETADACNVPSGSYVLEEYVRRVHELPLEREPIYIVVGPARAHWTYTENVERVHRARDLLAEQRVVI